MIQIQNDALTIWKNYSQPNMNHKSLLFFITNETREHVNTMDKDTLVLGVCRSLAPFTNMV